MKQSCPVNPGHKKPCLQISPLSPSSSPPPKPLRSSMPQYSGFFPNTRTSQISEMHQYPKTAFSPSLLLSKIFHQLSMVSAPAHPGLYHLSHRFRKAPTLP